MNKILMQGDCIEKMRVIDDNSIDAVVTDPPYGLEFMGKEWDKFATLEKFSNKEEGGFGGMKNHVRYGKDTKTFQQFTEQWAKECLRVLKPGGFLLAFGGTRTQHRLVAGIEDAGFEIRDMIAYMYGTGFPKSHNIGKSVDKLLGNKREEVGKGYRKMMTEGKNTYGTWAKDNFNITKGTSDWEGWGTALKPGMETICVARKPLGEKNNALNVLKWGTGGINIDGCRVGVEGGTKHIESEKEYNNEIYGKGLYKDFGKAVPNLGRFPSNIILDPEAAEMLDEQSGTSKSSNKTFKATDYIENETSTPFTRGDFIGKGDKGGASRFFYCAKPSKKERNMGCEELEEKIDCDRKTELDSADVPMNRSNNPKKNIHPTVKPIALMKYLVKLVSRENAIVLDPFLGSGTTGIAALELKRQFIGIEKSEEYMNIAKARIKNSNIQKKENFSPF